LLASLSFYLRDLRERHFDIAITPRGDTDEHLATLLCLLAHTGKRVGYSELVSKGKWRYNRGFHSAFDICLEPGPQQHEVERNLALIAALGGTVHHKQLEIHLGPADREYADQALTDVLEDSTVIAIGIGAQAPGRRWPIERYADVLRELAIQYPVFAVITCAPSEHPDAVRLAGMLPSSALISDSPNIRETCALLARCDLFIGNDTGAAHLAAAMDCPTVVISRHLKFGDPAHPNSPLRFAPWCASSRVLQPERGFGGCTARCTHVEPHCIKQVTVSEVVLAAKTMLMQSERTRDMLAVTLSL
jgi:heptosyltransferase-2